MKSFQRPLLPLPFYHHSSLPLGCRSKAARLTSLPRPYIWTGRRFKIMKEPVAKQLPEAISTSLLRDPETVPQFSKGELSRAGIDPHSPFDQFERWFAEAGQAGEKAPETTTFTTVRLPEGRPSSRIVYLKQLIRAEPPGSDDSGVASTRASPVSGSGFVIYSNWGTSQKAADLKTNPLVSLTFWWQSQERQVRVQGRAVALSLGPEEGRSKSDSTAQAYFDTRPRGSRIGAWASRQSAVIDDDRGTLDRWVQESEARWGEGEQRESIACPPFWGGVLIIPDEVEFWQGRKSRLHDRFRYTRTDERVSSRTDLPKIRFPGEPEAEGEGGSVYIGEGTWKIERLSP